MRATTRRLRAQAHRLLPHLVDWRPWGVLFALGFVAILVWNISLTNQLNRTSNNQSRDEAARVAEQIAGADSKYSQCIASIPLATKINHFIETRKIEDNVLVGNAKAVLDATPKDDPVYKARLEGLKKLRVAAAGSRGIHFDVPTKQDCRELRRELRRQPFPGPGKTSAPASV